MPRITLTGVLLAVLGLIVAQVILPAMFDLLVALAIAGAAGWAGYRYGRTPAS